MLGFRRGFFRFDFENLDRLISLAGLDRQFVDHERLADIGVLRVVIRENTLKHGGNDILHRGARFQVDHIDHGGGLFVRRAVLFRLDLFADEHLPGDLDGDDAVFGV